MSNLTLGSLFDGSGGFPLGGLLTGITPVWASEIEPFPIRVTTKRMPFVKHYGDVSAMDGGKIEPVDIITWGSPCQDLSIVGKRAGLSGSRSGLYVEAVRIVKEMLEATDGKYPKFCVFENVPGLLSSNDGADFYACLDMMQELGYLPDANILDAQFMGVPQRRKRVYITWVQVDYILQRRTHISDSITLQLLTEILQMNLAGLLEAYGIELKKSAANVRNQSGDGVKRRNEYGKTIWCSIPRLEELYSTKDYRLSPCGGVPC